MIIPLYCFFSYLCPCICLLRLLCHPWMTKLVGGALHCGISDTVRFVFGDLNYHNQIPSKDNSRGEAYGCVYTQPECAEGYSCPQAHFWVNYIY